MGTSDLRRFLSLMNARDVPSNTALQARRSWIGSVLWRSSISERPSGRTERRLNKFLAPGKAISRGLESESWMDISKLDLLSWPWEREVVFSVSQRDKTLEYPS